MFLPVATPRHPVPPRIFGAKGRRKSRRRVSERDLIKIGRAFDAWRSPPKPQAVRAGGDQRPKKQLPAPRRRPRMPRRHPAPIVMPRQRAPRVPRVLIAAGRHAEGSHDDGGGGSGDGCGPPPRPTVLIERAMAPWGRT